MKNKQYKIYSFPKVPLLTLMIFFMPSCTEENGDRLEQLSSVKVGVLMSDVESWEKQVLNGIQLSLSHYKKSKSCQYPRAIELVIDNTQSNPEAATRASSRLIKTQQVNFLIGPNISRTALPVTAIAEKYKVPMLSVLSNHPQLVDNKKFIFQFSPKQAIQSRLLVDYLVENTTFKTAAILFDVADRYSRSYAEAFERDFKNRGGKVLLSQGYTNSVGDSDRIFSELKALAPDIIFSPNRVSHAKLQANKAREVGLDSVFVGADFWEVKEAKGIPELDQALIIDNWHITQVGTEPEDIRIIEQYKTMFGVDMSSPSAMGFDAFALVWRSLCESPNLQPEVIVEHFSAIANYHGLTGDIHRIRSNQIIRDLVLLKIDRGEVKVLKHLVINEGDFNSEK